MVKSFDGMKETLVNLTEEPNEDALLNSDAERETENVSNKDGTNFSNFFFSNFIIFTLFTKRKQLNIT